MSSSYHLQSPDAVPLKYITCVIFFLNILKELLLSSLSGQFNLLTLSHYLTSIIFLLNILDELLLLSLCGLAQ
jgi:hypothetical protein